MIKIKKLIHYQNKINNVLCCDNIYRIKYFTNDIHTVTCKLCKNLYDKEEIKKMKNTKDNINLREVFNKKKYTKSELDNVLNCFESGYGEI